jgi:hypothetical protein
VPDSVSAEQLVALLESLGFYQERSTDHWFMNSDSKLRKGPKAIYVDLGTATTLPLAVIRIYLRERGMHPVHLDDAIKRMFDQ